MTRIKLCGLMHPRDIHTANELKPEYIGFVFAGGSRRYVSKHKAKELKARLSAGISAVGVFVDEEVGTVAEYLNEGIIDMAQLHGGESEVYIKQLRELSSKPVIKAFQIKSQDDLKQAESTTADHILLDAGKGDGKTFDWAYLEAMDRPYFLAGGLDPDNVHDAVRRLKPFAVDVSSGIETDGAKDADKMRAFTDAVRSA